ncbi:MAG: molybdenum cofactor guanylyltransferase MobA [Niveispirillum sp.]|uniref:molybdenum cofactor guanylyltransferase MobA n=1 Tax=Niveispirillum sp. TaxID=1917217 RepID=UPI003BA5C877
MKSGKNPVVVILAGGQARRMGGGDKGLINLGNKPILRHVLDRARLWTDRIVVSANEDPARFRELDWLADIPILADGVPDRPGPLAGILAGMDWVAEQAPDRTHILSLPCDTPFLPADLWPVLAQGAAGGVAMAQGADGQRHPTVALWPVALRQDLRQALMEEGLRKVGAFAARHGLVAVPFPARPGGIDPFFNINDPADQDRATTLIRSAGP